MYKKNIYRPYFFLLISSLIYYGCSSTQETVKEENSKSDEIYVFDEVPTDTVKLDQEPTITNPVPPTITKYYIQIGAFTTREKANEFASASRKSLKKEVFVKFSPDVELFVLHLAAFNTREDAEKMRNELWKKKEFKDAFILTIDEAIGK
ncbi:MAG: SPOR domain-containing protein [Ignavibacteriaceae bacterium]